jgi:hypothetical protein
MKTTIRVLTLLSLLSAGILLHAGDITVGTYTNGNCYPLMCNDSGTNSGTTMDYQQVYASTAFSGTVAINSVTFNLASFFGGSDLVLGGTYTLEWGYAAPGSVNNLSANLASNYTGGPHVLGMFTISAGGSPFGLFYTLPPNFQFTYNSSLGDLLLQITANGQDNVPAGMGNSYMEADETGSVTSRAYCIENVGCFADQIGLVTTFGIVPEPGSLAIVIPGLVGLAGAFRWKKLI